MTNAKPTSLTKRCVDAMKPAQARYDVFDIRVRGFALRVHLSGRKTYRFKYVAGDRQRVVTIGEHGAPWTAELARAQAMILRGQVAGGVDPTDEAAARKAQALDQARRALTVEALIECWLVDGRAEQTREFMAP